MKLSIVITTYNRRDLVREAIDSALSAVADMKDAEIIVVDDCSTDDTLAVLNATYMSRITAGILKIEPLPENRGVTGAKNAGARLARGEWVMFLDSDDTLLPGSTPAIRHVLEAAGNAPIIFFRCKDANGQVIGRQISGVSYLTIEDIVNNRGVGECLPLVQRDIFLQHPYDEDLRGFEGLTYCRIMKQAGNIMLSDKAVRFYRVDNLDRISARRQMFNRSCLLAKGHFRIIREFSSFMGKKATIKQCMKIAIYSILCAGKTLKLKLSK